MKPLKQPISPERKRTLLKLLRMPTMARARLLELEALRRGLDPKTGRATTPIAPVQPSRRER